MTQAALNAFNQLSVAAKIIRADGTVEDLGLVSYWHRNPLKRMAWAIKQFVRGKRAGTVTYTPKG